jgi:tetratricopeptide (TPR) repeat protein
VNTEAYTLYLQAHALRTSAGGNGSLAIDYLHRSTRLDPTFALAWAELAATIASEFSTLGILPYATADTEAHAAAQEALRLDPQLPLAHLALARLFAQIEWNWDAAESEISKVIEVEPGNAEAYRVSGYLATTRGRFDEAIELLQRAASLDPLQPWNYIAMGFPVYRKYDYALAQTLYRKAIQLSPIAAGGKVHYLLGSVLLMRGQLPEALAEMERETDPGFRNCGLALVFDALGRKREANRELAVAEKDHAQEKPYWIALVYALRKDADKAFLWLDRAAEQHDPGMLWIKGDPMLQGLVEDPRYKALLRKMKLAE